MFSKESSGLSSRLGLNGKRKNRVVEPRPRTKKELSVSIRTYGERIGFGYRPLSFSEENTFRFAFDLWFFAIVVEYFDWM